MSKPKEHASHADQASRSQEPSRPNPRPGSGPPDQRPLDSPPPKAGFGAGYGFRDNVWLGLGLGLMFPAATWLALEALSDHSLGIEVFGYPFAGFSDSFVATMAVCTNFIPFVVFMRARRDHAMRGVGLVTMVLALIVVAVYFLQLGEPA